QPESISTSRSPSSTTYTFTARRPSVGSGSGTRCTPGATVNRPGSVQSWATGKACAVTTRRLTSISRTALEFPGTAAGGRAGGLPGHPGAGSAPVLSDPARVLGDPDGLDPGPGPGLADRPAQVVADRPGAQEKLGRDVLDRGAADRAPEHLPLPVGE